MKFVFPPEMVIPIKRAIFGFFGGLKNNVLGGVKNLYGRAKAKLARNVIENNI